MTGERYPAKSFSPCFGNGRHRKSPKSLACRMSRSESYVCVSRSQSHHVAIGPGCSPAKFSGGHHSRPFARKSRANAKRLPGHEQRGSLTRLQERLYEAALLEARARITRGECSASQKDAPVSD